MAILDFEAIDTDQRHTSSGQHEPPVSASLPVCDSRVVVDDLEQQRQAAIDRIDRMCTVSSTALSGY